MRLSKNRAYTLVEVIVVIGIIAVLTTLVYASLNGAKAQNRDQKKVADISNIQLALEMYFNRNRQYPSKLWPDSGDPVTDPPLTYLVPEFLPAKIDTPASGGYNYFPIGGSKCSSYHLWTVLESKISALESRKGFNSLGLTPCGDTDLRSLYEDKKIEASSNPLIYDVTP